jgi:HK97 family phage portal protein
MFQKILTKFGYEKKSYAPQVYSSSKNPFFPSALPSIYLKYYNEIAPVGDAINKIASEACNVPLFPYTDKEEGIVEDIANKFVNLFAKPNFHQTGRDFKKEGFIHYLATGNNFIYLTGVLNASDRYEGVGSKVTSSPMEVYNLRPDLVTPIVDSFGWASGYYYNMNGGQKTFNKKDVRNINGELVQLFVDDKLGVLLHFKEPSTSNSCYGDSMLFSVEAEIKQYHEASLHNIGLLESGLSAKHIFSPKDPSIRMTPTDLDIIRDRISGKYSGAGNSGKTIVVGNAFDVKQLDVNLKDMDFQSLMQRMRVAIYNKMNIPLALTEGTFAATSNMKESNLNFYDRAVLPLVDKYCDFLYHFVYKDFFVGKKIVKVGYNPTSIIALQPRMLETVLALRKSSVTTINEMRKYVGLGRTDVGGDAIYIDGNQTAIAGDEDMTDTIGVAVNTANNNNDDTLKSLLENTIDIKGKRVYSDEDIKQALNK